ncbi:MAG: hypothetical protein FJ297_03630 [Planctomycetes bacterium]|nr:hypothetical protein [Planctomycetota bacterium]
MAGHGGGAWKVAYADFVTAMMAFFMVMWLISQSEKVKEAVAKHFREPPSNGQLLPPLIDLYPKDGLAPEAPKNPGQLSTENQDIPPEFDPDRGNRSAVGEIVLFDETTAELTEDAKKRLDELIPRIVGRPQKIELRGHASRRPLPPDGPYRDAWHLSYERAVAVLRHLEARGIPSERIRLTSAGSHEPFTIGTDPNLMRRNSSVEIFLLNELATHLVGTESEREGRFMREDPANAGHASSSSTAHPVKAGSGDSHATGSSSSESHAPRSGSSKSRASGSGSSKSHGSKSSKGSSSKSSTSKGSSKPHSASKSH